MKFYKHPEAGPVTVILLNYKRPDNVKRIIQNMVTYSNVGEIIVLSNNPNSTFSYSHKKVVVLDMLSYGVGVAVRFKACLLATYWHVLIADDDLYVTKEGLDNLLKARHQHPWSIVGFFGREYNHNNPVYNMNEAGPGHHSIALTRALLLDTCTCRAFWEASHLMQDLTHAAATIWNGEDIYMSLVSKKVLGGDPFITPAQPGVDLEFLEEGKVGVSASQDHLAHRSKFLQTALKRLECF